MSVDKEFFEELNEKFEKQQIDLAEDIEFFKSVEEKKQTHYHGMSM